MQQILAALGDYGTTFLISAATIAIAVVVAWLANADRTVSSHVCRVGRRPARVEVPDARGTVAVSVRPMDASHIWLRVEAPPAATVRASGEDESMKGADNEPDHVAADGPQRRLVVPDDGGTDVPAERV